MHREDPLMHRETPLMHRETPLMQWNPALAMESRSSNGIPLFLRISALSPDSRFFSVLPVSRFFSVLPVSRLFSLFPRFLPIPAVSP